MAITFTSIEVILQTLINFPILSEIMLDLPRPLFGEIKFDMQVALYRGLDQFHHSRKLTIPGELLCSMVPDRLGQLQDLRSLKITSTSAHPYFTLTSDTLNFQTLRSLDTDGPLSFICTLAFVLPQCPFNSIHLSLGTSISLVIQRLERYLVQNFHLVPETVIMFS